MTVQVRRCTAADVTEIAKTENPGADVAVRLFARQERGGSLYLVAWCEGSPTGTGELLFGSPPEIRHLHVDSTHRGRGIGSALIRAAEAEVGSGPVSIGVGAENVDARRLYRRLGYTGTGAMTSTTYTYVDVNGEEQTATELDELFIKTL